MDHSRNPIQDSHMIGKNLTTWAITTPYQRVHKLESDIGCTTRTWTQSWSSTLPKQTDQRCHCFCSLFSPFFSSFHSFIFFLLARNNKMQITSQIYSDSILRKHIWTNYSEQELGILRWQGCMNKFQYGSTSLWYNLCLNFNEAVKMH